MIGFQKLVLVVGLMVFSGTTLALTNTKVIFYQPTLAKMSQSTSVSKEGSCWVNSIAVMRADAWRCSIKNQIYDPCFSGVDFPGWIVCDADPSKNAQGFWVKLIKPLPSREKIKPPLINIWMLKLTDGSVCQPFTGTLPFIPEKKRVTVISYGCSSSSSNNLVGIVENSIKPGAVWRVQKISYSSGGLVPKINKIQEVTVDTVWR